ncbi:hypothetical protein C8F04DRAFT_1122621 [Mycena alexandri]|uniref:Uncharacterized protein n=1 Tax=Mycena alexandri TaxID=1745969 RepID=A0AAD6WWJ7_9AGAR|nr:hypothetical protein C8F04DRAFT_1122621 [Mycena alexandri]
MYGPNLSLQLPVVSLAFRLQLRILPTIPALLVTVLVTYPSVRSWSVYLEPECPRTRRIRVLLDSPAFFGGAYRDATSLSSSEV